VTQLKPFGKVSKGAMGIGLFSCQGKSIGTFTVVNISSPSSGVDLKCHKKYVAIYRHKNGEWEFLIVIKASESAELTMVVLWSMSKKNDVE
jgi:hypothetical protein